MADCRLQTVEYTRQCRLVLWVERVWRLLIEVHGVYQQEKSRPINSFVCACSFCAAETPKASMKYLEPHYP